MARSAGDCAGVGRNNRTRGDGLPGRWAGNELRRKGCPRRTARAGRPFSRPGKVRNQVAYTLTSGPRQAQSHRRFAGRCLRTERAAALHGVRHAFQFRLGSWPVLDQCQSSARTTRSTRREFSATWREGKVTLMQFRPGPGKTLFPSLEVQAARIGCKEFNRLSAGTLLVPYRKPLQHQRLEK